MEYRFSPFFFYLCSWRHLVSGVALGLLGYVLGAVLATIARSLVLSVMLLDFLATFLVLSLPQLQGPLN